MFASFLDDTMTYSCAIFKVNISPNQWTFFFSVLCVTNVLKSILSRLKSILLSPSILQGPEEPLIDAQMRKINHMIDKV